MSQSALDELVEMLEEKAVPRALAALESNEIFWTDEFIRPAYDVLHDLLESRGISVLCLNPLPAEGVFVYLTAATYQVVGRHLEMMAVALYGQPES
ncbi:hypothetical protein D7X99_34090 [Corallococcus sp. AB032C]|uniref:hypothetical protein n=1 Tax=Corallococcus TaxID=83461 RepID=UPI000EC22B8D|nr:MULTISPECIES: hypothetical protein [Corallococcus]NPC48253.1 hypothetical protein [Corallococcus exiguus]RKH76660.1 hypothetical protein D7X99_34090 [Corallococcus sp. AB032C]